jgi:hypothetical protein
MTHTTVHCKCGANVIPRLWHRYGNVFSYTLTEHICPICGVVMYETGGGIRRLFVIAASIAFFMLGIGYLSMGKSLTFLISITAALSILFLSYPTFYGRLIRRIIGVFHNTLKQVSQA